MNNNERPRKAGIHVILSSLATAEQVASRMRYASAAAELAVSTTVNKDEKTTLSVNHKAQEVNEKAIQLVKLFNESFQLTIENIQSVAEEFKSTDEAIGNQFDEMFPLMENMRNFQTYRKAKNG